MYTRQQTFDMVVEGLRKQGCSSVDDGLCKYRDSKGHKCAAGMLISDEDYKPEFEGHSVPEAFEVLDDIPDNMVKIQLRNLISKNHDLELVKKLQLTHDVFDENVWEHEWKTLALDNNLVYTEPCTT